MPKAKLLSHETSKLVTGHKIKPKRALLADIPKGAIVSKLDSDSNDPDDPFSDAFWEDVEWPTQEEINQELAEQGLPPMGTVVTPSISSRAQPQLQQKVEQVRVAYSAAKASLSASKPTKLAPRPQQDGICYRKSCTGKLCNCKGKSPSITKLFNKQASASPLHIEP